MSVRNPLHTYGFEGNITVVPRRALALAGRQNPQNQTAVEMFEEELVTVNVRDAMYNISEPTGMTWKETNEHL